jgi:hypothetical protein
MVSIATVDVWYGFIVLISPRLAPMLRFVRVSISGINDRGISVSECCLQLLEMFQVFPCTNRSVCCFTVLKLVC